MIKLWSYFKKTCFKIKMYNKLVCVIFLLFSLFSCTTVKLPPEPPKYIEQKNVSMDKEVTNSLWNERSMLFGDVKAKALNDIVMIRVVENITGLGKADTKTSKDSSLDATIEKLLGAPLNLNKSNFWGKNNTLSPDIKGGMKDNFKGNGETTRQSRLDATISAKVVEVLPNGNLVLESRKEIIINRENQILILKGIVRPEDIQLDNTVLSTKIADAKIYLVGEGVVGDKQGQGWLVRVLDKIWPF